MRYLASIAVILILATTLGHGQSAVEDFSQAPQPRVHMFPNPAVDYLHVRLEGVDVSKLQLAVHNIIGNEIPVEVEPVALDEVRIRVKEFPVGYYLLALRDEESNFKGTYKFVKR